ncbi:hypothetical protein LWI29_028377 [Acer saccharum]|uniref:Uncharacterized protein n=1 Tax=Acer saccharum TaxID=4024 RepID=A0AA39VG30_ACESA|nr:hypothetical protein LWI29_028377 [Acer saccharum]
MMMGWQAEASTDGKKDEDEEEEREERWETNASSNITSGSDDLLLSSLDLDDLNHLDLARSDLHLALTIWICVHLHSRWSGLVLVLRGGGFGFGDCGGGGGGGGGLKGCLGFLGFLG